MRVVVAVSTFLPFYLKKLYIKSKYVRKQMNYLYVSTVFIEKRRNVEINARTRMIAEILTSTKFLHKIFCNKKREKQGGKMEIREYQKDLINNIRAEVVMHKKRICAVLGCGGGKSVIQGNIAAEAAKKKYRVLFIVHRKELCRQIERTFRKCGVDF